MNTTHDFRADFIDYQPVYSIGWLIEYFHDSREARQSVGKKLSEISRLFNYPIIEMPSKSGRYIQHYHREAIGTFKESVMHKPLFLKEHRKKLKEQPCLK